MLTLSSGFVASIEEVQNMNNDSDSIANEAKAIVALAFRNGPIEYVHAGEQCPTCSRDSHYSGITQSEMKDIMKNAVNSVYALLLLKDQDPDNYNFMVQLGLRSTTNWDDPENRQSWLSP